MALASKGLFATGVSTDLNVTFVSSAKLGQTMNVVSIYYRDKIATNVANGVWLSKDAKCVKLGRTLAFTEINVSADGKIGKKFEIVMGSRELILMRNLQSQKSAKDDTPNLLH